MADISATASTLAIALASVESSQLTAAKMTGRRDRASHERSSCSTRYLGTTLVYFLVLCSKLFEEKVHQA